MKKSILKIISAVLTVALLICAVPTSVFAQNTDFGEIQIGVMTDLHYYAQANIDDKDKATEVCEKTICTVSSIIFFFPVTLPRTVTM